MNEADGMLIGICILLIFSIMFSCRDTSDKINVFNVIGNIGITVSHILTLKYMVSWLEDNIMLGFLIGYATFGMIMLILGKKKNNVFTTTGNLIIILSFIGTLIYIIVQYIS